MLAGCFFFTRLWCILGSFDVCTKYQILFGLLIDIQSIQEGFWHGPPVRRTSAMHYSTWLTLLGLVRADSKHHRDSGADLLKRFSHLKFGKVWIPLCALCLSQRGVNEWRMNNAGQDAIVRWRPLWKPRVQHSDFVKYWFTTCKLLCGCCLACRMWMEIFWSTHFRLGKQTSGLILANRSYNTSTRKTQITSVWIET